MPLARFEPTIPASEWPQTHTLDAARLKLARYFQNIKIFGMILAAVQHLSSKHLQLELFIFSAYESYSIHCPASIWLFRCISVLPWP